MGSSNADLKTRIDAVRHKILSYKPGKAVPCDDERVVFPDKLVIGMINVSWSTNNIDNLRRAVHGDVEASKLADKRQTSTEDQGEYLTDSISLIESTNDVVEEDFQAIVQDLAGKVECIMLLIDLTYFRYIKWITLTKEVTGRAPLCALLPDDDIPIARNKLTELGITDIYEVNRLAHGYSYENQFQWLDLLHGYLQEGDRAFATNKMKKICKSLNEKTKEARRQVERLQTEKEDERARSEKEKRSLESEMTNKLDSKQQRVDTLTEIVGEKERNETALRQQVEELTKGREEDRARGEKEKRSLAAEMTKKVESKQLHVETLKKTVGEKERNETTLRQQVEEITKAREGDRARAEKEKRSLAADMTMKLESKQHLVDALTEILGKKERNETTLEQQVKELTKGREGDRAGAEKKKRSLAAEMMKNLESKHHHVDALTDIVDEKERNETTLKQQVEQLEQAREGNRAKGEKEKRSLTAEMTKNLESKQQRVDALTDSVDEKGRNETALKQQVEELKKGRERDRARFEKEKQLIELSWKKELESKEQQLGRENWKLRTKIQLESEIRSAEQKKAETRTWNFIPWVTSGKQAQGGTSSFEDNSTGGLGRSDTLRAGEEPPDDEFAGILRQIADDLYDEAKIDSLAGQLGILHGDIKRALMTNMRFNTVTSDGTRQMLKQWREGVSREDERIELTKALQAAKLVNLADLYLSGGAAEKQIDAECVSKEVNDQQLSTGDETPLQEDQNKGQTDTQVLQEATASNDHTPRDGHTGDMASITQEDLTDGSRSQHPDKSTVRSSENLDASEITSEDVSYEEVHAGDYMTNVSSIQPAEQSSSHEMQVLPEDMPKIAPVVSSGGKPNEESTTLDKSHVGGIISNEEDLISQLVLIDTSPEKILVLFLVKIIMDVSHRALSS